MGYLETEKIDGLVEEYGYEWIKNDLNAINGVLRERQQREKLRSYTANDLRKLFMQHGELKIKDKEKFSEVMNIGLAEVEMLLDFHHKVKLKVDYEGDEVELTYETKFYEKRISTQKTEEELTFMMRKYAPKMALGGLFEKEQTTKKFNRHIEWRLDQELEKINDSIGFVRFYRELVGLMDKIAEKEVW